MRQILLLVCFFSALNAIEPFSPYCKIGPKNNEIINVCAEERIIFNVQDIIDGYNMTYKINQKPDEIILNNPTVPQASTGINNIVGDLISSDAFMAIGQEITYGVLAFDSTADIYNVYVTSQSSFLNAPSFTSPVRTIKKTDVGLNITCFTVTVISQEGVAIGCFGQKTGQNIRNYIQLVYKDNAGSWQTIEFEFDNWDPSWTGATDLKAQRLYDESLIYGQQIQFYLIYGYPTLKVQTTLPTNQNNSIYVYDIEFGFLSNKHEIRFVSNYQTNLSKLNETFSITDFTTSNNQLYIISRDILIGVDIFNTSGHFTVADEVYFALQYSSATIGVYEDRESKYIALVGYGVIQQFDWSLRKYGAGPRLMNMYQSNIVLQGSERVYFTPLYIAVKSPDSVLIYERGQTEFKDLTHIIQFQNQMYDFLLFENDYAIGIDKSKSSLFWVNPPHIIADNIQNDFELNLEGISSNGTTETNCAAQVFLRKVIEDKEIFYQTAKESNLTLSLNPNEKESINLDLFFQGYNFSFLLDSNMSKVSNSNYSLISQQKGSITFAFGVPTASDTIFMQTFDLSSFNSTEFLVFTQEAVTFNIYIQKCVQDTQYRVKCTLEKRINDTSGKEPFVKAKITQMSFKLVKGNQYFGFVYGTLKNNPTQDFILYEATNSYSFSNVSLAGTVADSLTDVDIIGELVYLVQPNNKKILIFRIENDGSLTSRGELGDQIVNDWSLSQPENWTPFQLHINQISTDLFTVECQKGIFLISIADNQAFYLSYIPLTGDLLLGWSRIVAIQSKRMLVIELKDTDFTSQITEYSILNPYFPLVLKTKILEDFNFISPLIGTFSQYTYFQTNTFVYLLGEDQNSQGNFYILSYQLGQPKINSISFSPFFPFIKEGSSPLLSVSTFMTTDYLLLLQGDGTKNIYEYWVLPHEPTMNINSDLPKGFAFYQAFDELNVQVSNSQGTKSVPIHINVAVINNQNNIYINDTETDQDRQFAQVPLDSSSLSFSDEGWIQGSYLSLNLQNSPGFTLQNQIQPDFASLSFMFEDIVYVQNQENLVAALNSSCSIFMIDANSRANATFVQSKIGFDCSLQPAFFRSDANTLFTYSIAQNDQSEWTLFVVSWNTQISDGKDYLKPTLILDGVKLDGLEYFPKNIQATSQQDIFVLSIDPNLFNIQNGALLYFELDITGTLPLPTSVPIKQTYKQGLCGIPFDFDILSYEITSISGLLYVAILDRSDMGLNFFPLDINFDCQFAESISISQLFAASGSTIPQNVILSSIHTIQVSELRDFNRAELLLLSENAAIYQFFIDFSSSLGQIESYGITNFYSHYGSATPFGNLKVFGNNFALQYYYLLKQTYVLAIFEISGLQSASSSNAIKAGSNLAIQYMAAGINVTISGISPKNRGFCFYTTLQNDVRLGVFSSQDSTFYAYLYNQNLTLEIASSSQRMTHLNHNFLMKMALQATQQKNLFFAPQSDFIQQNITVKRVITLVDPISPTPTPTPIPTPTPTPSPVPSTNDTSSSTGDSSLDSSSSEEPVPSSTQDNQGNQNSLTWLWITLGVLGGLILVAGVFYFIRKRKNNSKNKQSSQFASDKSRLIDEIE